MKRFLAALSLFLLILPSLQAQKRSYLFPSFVEAHISFINRSEADVPLNFDALNQTLYYYDGDTLMELVNPELIREVLADGRRFVMRDGKFCEVIRRESGNVLVNGKFKHVNVGSKGALGATTQAKVEVLNARSDDVDEIWTWKNENTYFFRVGEQYYSARRLKDLYKAFPAQASGLKAYARENKLMMTNAEEAFLLIDRLRALAAE